MKKFITSFLAVALVFTGSFSLAQDVQFSNLNQVQFLNNPAISGCASDLEVNIVYRNQWRNVNSKFESMAAGIAGRIKPGKRRAFGNIGWGLNAYQDKSMRNILTTSLIQANVAYHLKIYNHQLSTAIYGGYSGMNYGANEAWASQHDGISYVPSMESGETGLVNQSHKMDAGLGFLYTIFQNEKMRKSDIDPFMQVGLAVYHTANPDLPVKTVGTFQMSLPLKKNKLLISPQMLYAMQGKFQKAQVGANLVYLANEVTKSTGSYSNPTRASFAFGLFYTFTGNFTSVMRVSHRSLIFHLSYDKLIFNPKAGFTNSAFEVGMAYRINSAKAKVPY